MREVKVSEEQQSKEQGGSWVSFSTQRCSWALHQVSKSSRILSVA